VAKEVVTTVREKPTTHLAYPVAVLILSADPKGTNGEDKDVA
jgi:hypothetical protein